MLEWLLNNNSDELIFKILANHIVLAEFAFFVVGAFLYMVLPKEYYKKLSESWKAWRSRNKT